MRDQVTETTFRTAGWQKQGADWYWFHPETTATRVRVRGTRRGDEVKVISISVRVNDESTGTLWNGAMSNWALLDDLDPAVASVFHGGLAAVGLIPPGHRAATGPQGTGVSGALRRIAQIAASAGSRVIFHSSVSARSISRTVICCV
ncbi:hypothetical protein R5H30_09565 [Sulfitobacter sp. D35]|uniref:hypothetical protein n=1 Tax=Sulfitobacter sp. D35 TaxID=3083252 RepID=UPI00296E5BD6|nr:hypothetical protein [Sulfitobacter sp. D35]MDW4498226.1 hypothetical protein [Sulfitobacter sp. D35]